MLQSKKERVTLTFDVYPGENSAITMTGGFLLAIAMVFMSLAF
jgi:hypothetical protein